jgi:hypothetical protein
VLFRAIRGSIEGNEGNEGGQHFHYHFECVRQKFENEVVDVLLRETAFEVACFSMTMRTEQLSC